MTLFGSVVVLLMRAILRAAISIAKRTPSTRPNRMRRLGLLTRAPTPLHVCQLPQLLAGPVIADLAVAWTSGNVLTGLRSGDIRDAAVLVGFSDVFVPPRVTAN